MSTSPALATTGSGLSEAERVVDVFIAPSKTFADILRSASWWLPFLLIALMGVAQSVVVDRQVGFDRVSENQIHASPKAEDRLNQLTPEQRRARSELAASIVEKLRREKESR